MPFHVLEHHSECRLREQVITVRYYCHVHSNQEPAAHALSWQPFSPSVCKLCAAPLTLGKMRYMTHGFSFIYRFPYAADTVRKYALPLVQKINLLFCRGVGEKGLCFEVQQQFFSDYLHVDDVFGMWQQCLEHKKKPHPCHFIWDNL